jgi:geranylgeranyl diphosphate synthase type II
MTLKEQLKINAELTEKVLKKSLEGYADKHYEKVVSAMNYSLLAGGKRVRPFLLIEFYKLCGGKDVESILPFAAAIEMIHTCSLIHDDLPCMDDDDLRRGKPSCHKQYGEDIALLAGDALLTYAFEIILTSSFKNPELTVKATGILANKVGISGMIGGQTIDVLSEGKKIDESLLKEIHLLKTSAFISAACEMGAVLAGASDDDCKNAEKYGEKIGLAFQIIDDILDHTATEEELGKPIGSDEENNKTTYYSLYGKDGASKKAEELTVEAENILKSYKNDNSILLEFTDYLLRRGN